MIHAGIAARARAMAAPRAVGSVAAPPPPPAKRWTATTARELFAVRALAQLADSDPDRANEVNGAGFSKFDGSFGHSMANRLAAGEALTEKQWTAVFGLVRKYRRQVGEAPPEGLPG